MRVCTALGSASRTLRSSCASSTRKRRTSAGSSGFTPGFPAATHKRLSAGAHWRYPNNGASATNTSSTVLGTLMPMRRARLASNGWIARNRMSAARGLNRVTSSTNMITVSPCCALVKARPIGPQTHSLAGVQVPIRSASVQLSLPATSSIPKFKASATLCNAVVLPTPVGPITNGASPSSKKPPMALARLAMALPTARRKAPLGQAFPATATAAPGCTRSSRLAPRPSSHMLTATRCLQGNPSAIWRVVKSWHEHLPYTEPPAS